MGVVSRSVAWYRRSTPLQLFACQAAAEAALAILFGARNERGAQAGIEAGRVGGRTPKRPGAGSYRSRDADQRTRGVGIDELCPIAETHV